MARDANAVYTLPAIYRAVTGAIIEAIQHNTPLEDIEKAITDSLARNGAGGMTGPLKLTDGTATNPGLGFNAAPGLGLLRSANGLAVTVGGVIVAEFTTQGLIGLPLGTPIPVLDGELPGLCVWADGRNISRTTYARLFTKWGERFGAGDGTTTFAMPDWRGRGFIGRDNFGGADASRLVNVPAVSGNRQTAGSVLGANLHTLTIAELAAHPHNVTGTAIFNDIYAIGTTAIFSDVPGWQTMPLFYMSANSTIPNSGSVTGTAANAGGGGAHNNVPQSIVCDIAIYAGA